MLDRARHEKSRLGYFPALYRKVTTRVKEGIRDGRFEDGERMERLDVVFANRYLEALAQHQSGRQSTRAWQVAFDAASSWWPIVVQHLLLGINAHINLDLGIAAARTAPGHAIEALTVDFDRINELLAELVDEVEAELATIWPKLRWLVRVSGEADNVVIDFSMKAARDQAWRLARELAPLPLAAQAAPIARVDAYTALLGSAIRRPGTLTRLKLVAIRLGERGSVPEIIDLLR